MNAQRKISTSSDAKLTSDGLFKAKHYCWCKAVAISLLIVFILILILSNVDFSGNAYNHKILIENDNWLRVTNGSLQVKRGRSIPQSAFGFECRQGENECVLICSGGNTNNIYKELEPLHSQCGNTTELYLYYSSFPFGAMKQKFLQGSFLLKTLAIIDCNLVNIEANAFRHDSVKTLKNLYLINTKFTMLSSNTFNGLPALQVLNITNKISASGFEGDKFLTPLVSTLESFQMRQVSRTAVAYDPLFWLRGSDLLHLKEVNLSNNNFRDKLSGKTFANCMKVEVLILANCSMEHLPKEVFDPMLKNLKHLDLSFNHFKILNIELVIRLKTLQSLYINSNEWDCSCKNMEFLKIMEEISQYTISGMGTLTCVTPLAMKDMKFSVVVIHCNGNITQRASTIDVSDMLANGNSMENGTIIPSNTTAMEDDTSVTSGEDTTEFSTETTTEMPTTTMTEASTSRTTPTEGTTTTTFRPTTTPPLYGLYVCRDINAGTVKTIDLLQALFNFSITARSGTSVHITIQNKYNMNFHLIYFTKYTDAVRQERRLISPLPRVNDKLLVEDLKIDTAYVFCLVANDRLSISPFDCQSYWLTISKDKVWIRANNKPWIVVLVVVGICICILLGGGVMTVILRRGILQTKVRRNQAVLSVPGCRRVSSSSYVHDVRLKDHTSASTKGSTQVNYRISTVGGPVCYEELDV